MLKSLAEFLERPAGEIFIGFVLIFVGAGFYFKKIPGGEALSASGSTLIARAMMSSAKPGLPPGMIGTQKTTTEQTAESPGKET